MVVQASVQRIGLRLRATVYHRAGGTNRCMRLGTWRLEHRLLRAFEDVFSERCGIGCGCWWSGRSWRPTFSDTLALVAVPRRYHWGGPPWRLPLRATRDADDRALGPDSDLLLRRAAAGRSVDPRPPRRRDAGDAGRPRRCRARRSRPPGTPSRWRPPDRRRED